MRLRGSREQRCISVAPPLALAYNVKRRRLCSAALQAAFGQNRQKRAMRNHISVECAVLLRPAALLRRRLCRSLTVVSESFSRCVPPLVLNRNLVRVGNRNPPKDCRGCRHQSPGVTATRLRNSQAFLSNIRFFFGVRRRDEAAADEAQAA
jgi:hypothetical protein